MSEVLNREQPCGSQHGLPSLAAFVCRPSRHGNGSDSNSKPLKNRRQVRPKRDGNRLLMFGRIRELALYRAEVLRNQGFEVAIPNSREEAIAAIRKGGFDVAVLTYTLSNETVQELAELIREYSPECAIVAITSGKGIDREIRPDEMAQRH
jgi:hypothetical protein